MTARKKAVKRTAKKVEWKWMKFRHKFAASVGPWQWREVLNDTASIQETLEELAGEYDHSGGYRGIDYVFFPHPDTDWLTTELATLREELAYKEKRLTRLERLARRLKTAKKA